VPLIIGHVPARGWSNKSTALRISYFVTRLEPIEKPADRLAVILDIDQKRVVALR